MKGIFYLNFCVNKQYREWVREAKSDWDSVMKWGRQKNKRIFHNPWLKRHPISQYFNFLYIFDDYALKNKYNMTLKPR